MIQAGRKACLPIALMLVIVACGGLSFRAWSSAASAGPLQSSSGASRVHDGSDPGLRFDILEASRQVRYESGGRNIFRMEEEIPHLATSVIRKRQPLPPPPSSAPASPSSQPSPFPIKYYGFASKPGEPRKVFLKVFSEESGSTHIFFSGKGDIVARRYRVVQITQNSVMMEDVLTGNRQPIPLEKERPR